MIDLPTSGVVDQVKGAAQETWGNVKDAAHEAGKTRQEEKQHKADEMRDNVTTKVEDAKKQRQRQDRLISRIGSVSAVRPDFFRFKDPGVRCHLA